jgi:predicted ATPase/DNA-binding winged helix-turn-helix (wHTH) protein
MKSWEFGPYRLIAHQRVLVRDQTPIPLGSRAFDLLVRLVESAGEVVSKEELMAAAWGDTIVEEANLRVHVAALRKALGENGRFITNVPLRGYSFIAPVRTSDAAGPERSRTKEGQAGVSRSEVRAGLPETIKRVIGRKEDLERIEASLRSERLVTITGAGGVGKTTVAIAAAKPLARAFRDGALLVELGALTDPKLVPSTFACALGESVAADIPADVLVGLLEEKELLVVIDNCEHVIDAAAHLIESILQGTTRVKILATSREALRAEGECLYRLPSLGLPVETMTAAETFESPAATLFLERASAVADGLEVAESDAPCLTEICRRLDGIPLALELAAGLVPFFGFRGLAANLDDRFRILTRGARTAMPRQRTLRATFDWSYALLSAEEKTFFRRLSVFRGPFSVEAATHVASSGPTPAIALLCGLVDKSLVNVDVGDEPEFWLLESSRTYGANEMAAKAEEEGVRRRHAEHFADLLTRSEPLWGTSTPATSRRLAKSIDDVRAALDWAFSPAGDVAIGVDLTISAAPLWNHLALYDESRRRYASALEAVASGPGVVGADQRLRWRMKLHALLASAVLLAGVGGVDTNAIGTLVADHSQQTLEAAQQLDDLDYKLRGLWGLWVSCYLRSRHREGLVGAQTFIREAERLAGASVASTGERMAAVSLHILGEHAQALSHNEAFLERTQLSSPTRRSRFTFDQRIAALTFKSRILWMLGRLDEATALVERVVEEARALDDTPSLYYVLIYAACPIADTVGDTRSARAFVAELRRISPPHGGAEDHWYRCWEAMLLVKEGKHAEGATLLRTTLAKRLIPDAACAPNRAHLATVLVEAAVADGDLDLALAEVETALGFANDLEEEWMRPELLRLKADVLLRRGGIVLKDEAHALYAEAIALAEAQEARFWQLRTATSLARALLAAGRAREARDVLAPAVDLVTGGDALVDVVEARALLAQTRRA